MNDLRNILILGLAVGCVVLWHPRGCNGPEAPAPAVKTKYVYDTTTRTVEVPVEKVVTRLTERWKTDTVRLVERVSDTVVRIDTVEIVRTFLEEHRRHVHLHKDSALKATITVDVYQNEVEGLLLEYSILRPIGVDKHYGDRFQMHVGATVGAQTDIATVWRPVLGMGLLGEFKTGTGVGLDYGHAIGSGQPHYFGLRATQRIRLRR